MAEPPYSVEEFWAIVTALTEDMKKCMLALEGLASDKKMEKRDEWAAFWHKMCAFSVFALIEGATYHLMYVAYVMRNMREVVFSLDELEVLEKAYDFDEERDVEAGLTMEQMLERIKFAFNAFARVHYSDYVLPTTEPEWQDIKTTFQTKKYLSYPQSPGELVVDNAGVEKLQLGATWFIQSLASLIKSCRDSAVAKFDSWGNDADEPVM